MASANAYRNPATSTTAVNVHTSLRPVDGWALVLTSSGSTILCCAPPPATLDRRDDLDTIHRHVANLVLATRSTPVPSAHKAARPGRVRIK